MSESAKMRLVRCPKCENLLSELADYSVYQCGGCGAVLRAKSKHQEGDSVSEKSDEEPGVVSLARLENSLEKRKVDSPEASNSEAKLISGSFRRDQSDFEAEKDDFRNGDMYRSPSNVNKECVVTENGLDRSLNRRDRLGRDQLVDPKSEHGSAATDFRRSGRMTNLKIGDADVTRISASNYRDEGPSNHHLGSESQSRARYLEQDRIALLRKLDELRDQLSRSCEVSDVPKEKVPFAPYSRPDKHAIGSPNFGRFPEPVPYANNNNVYEMPSNGFYPSSMPYPNRVPGYGEPFFVPPPQMHNGASHGFPRPPYQQPPHSYYSGQYVDNGPEAFEPYSHSNNNNNNAAFHHPSCHCFHCYEKRRHNSVPSDPINPRIGWHQNAMWPGDFNGRETGFSRGRVGGGGRRVMYSGGRRLRPVGAGAPFLSCTNCFEVLKLPKKARLADEADRKLKCGACSAVMDIALVDKKFVISVSSDKVISNENNAKLSYAFSSDDYDNSGYDFQAMDREPASGKARERETHFLSSSSLYTSDEEIGSGATNSAQQPGNADLSPPPPGSPLQDHFEFSTNNNNNNNSNNLANRAGKGNRSSRSDQEKVKQGKMASRQNSLNNKTSMAATEMEVSFNEYSNTGISQDSGDASRTEDPSRTNNNKGESFFANIIKKSFKDFSRDERGKINVFVNGHPITDRVLKKAQKLAGPVHTGHYWYDYRAGFWGIIGGPCLGIVLPHIEEFNYPMPEKCSGGTTGVFVNGRELHQKDLELLASRGLPASRDRSYIVEISGRVLDEVTGDEIDGLGKLAPTVEKAKHGFGMKAPKKVQTHQNS